MVLCSATKIKRVNLSIERSRIGNLPVVQLKAGKACKIALHLVLNEPTVTRPSFERKSLSGSTGTQISEKTLPTILFDEAPERLGFVFHVRLEKDQFRPALDIKHLAVKFERVL